MLFRLIVILQHYKIHYFSAQKTSRWVTINFFQGSKLFVQIWKWFKLGVLLAPLRTIQEKGEANVITVHRRKPSNPICFSANQLTLWWLVQWVVKSLYNILGWVKILSVKIAYHKIPIRLLEGSCYWRHQCPQLTKFEN